MEDLYEELNNKFDKPHSFCAYISKKKKYQFLLERNSI